MGFNPSVTLADVDLTNKTILITGSTCVNTIKHLFPSFSLKRPFFFSWSHTSCRSGIGFATAQVLVQQGAKVYLAARNQEKAASCIKRIEDSLTQASPSVKTDQFGKPQGQALFHQLDLTDPKDAKQSAEEFMQKEERLDVLSES